MIATGSPSARSRFLKVAALPLLVVGLYAIAIASTLTVPAVSRDYVAAVAAPFDLMVSVPVLAYVLVLRRAGFSPLFALPLVWIGFAASTQIVPADQRAFLSLLFAGAVAADVAVIGREAFRIVRAFRDARARHSDPALWFAPAIAPLFPNRAPAHLAGLEAATLFYAVGTWRRAADAPEGTQAFTTHKNGGYGAMIAGLSLALPAEVFAIHLLVAKYSPEAAIVVTALSLYSMLWLVGDWRATVLRPLLVTGDELVVRSGVRFTARIPLDAIASVGRTAPNLPKDEIANLAMLGSIPTWIVLDRPVPTPTFLGANRPTRAIALTLDDEPALRRAIEEVQAKRMPKE